MSRRRLAIIEQKHELRGQVPAAFEKLARTAETGSPAHLGLLRVSVALAQRALTSSLPPSARLELSAAHDALRSYTTKNGSVEQVLEQRKLCFSAVPLVEDLAVKAISEAELHLPKTEATPLDEHARHVVERYSRNAAHFAVSALIHALDGVSDPAALLLVPRDVEGARAYLTAGLGAARHQAFRKAAYDQAEWEASRLGGGEVEVRHLAVQIFHEYLGGRYRVHADAERLLIEDFIAWALSGAR